MSKRKPTNKRQSYAHQHDASLPGTRTHTAREAGKLKSSFDWNRDPLIRKQLMDQTKTEAERRQEQMERDKRRQNFMIKRQQPKPVLRPSRGLAYGPDKAAFNDQWRQEQQQAKQVDKSNTQPSQNKEERRAAFMQARDPNPIKKPNRNR